MICLDVLYLSIVCVATAIFGGFTTWVMIELFKK